MTSALLLLGCLILSLLRPDLHWDSYEGKLKGFATSSDAPQLDGARPHQDNTMEAHNMAGTDESV